MRASRRRGARLAVLPSPQGPLGALHSTTERAPAPPPVHAPQLKALLVTTADVTLGLNHQVVANVSLGF